MSEFNSLDFLTNSGITCTKVNRSKNVWWVAVLPIRDILTRIRNRGSVPLTTDQDPGILIIDLQLADQKKVIKKSQTFGKSRFFSLFLLDYKRIRTSE